jgi:hypothetical protein
MSLINMGELAYMIKRQQGMKKAEEIIKDLRSFPITFTKQLKSGFWLLPGYRRS